MGRYHMTKNGVRYRQKGVLALLTPILLLVVLMFGALVLDGARLYSLHEEMQTQADAIASAAAGGAQACGGVDARNSTLMQDRALAAAQRLFPGDGPNLSGNDIELGNGKGTFQMQPGVLHRKTGGDSLIFQSLASVDFPQSNAVRVVYTRQTPRSELLPFFGTMTLTASAAARNEAVATLSASGSTATVSGGLLGNLLNAVLSPGTPYTLDPTSLSSLRNTTIKMGNLLDTLKVNDVAALLPLNGKQFATALDTIANNKGLNGVAALLDDVVAADGIDTLKVSDVLNVAGSTSVPRNSQFSLYDAVMSLVLNLAKIHQAASDGLLSIPVSVSGLSIPGVASISVPHLDLHVGTAPKVAIGPAMEDASGAWVTRFYAPDITLGLDANVQLLDISGVSLASISLPLAVGIGGGSGALVGVDCARGTNNSATLTVRLDRQPARIMTGTLTDGTGTLNPQDIEVDLLGLLNTTLVKIRLGLDTRVDGTTQDVTLSPDYPLYCSATDGCALEDYQDTGGGLGGLDLGLNVDSVDVLGLNLGFTVQDIINSLTPILNQVVAGLAQTLVNPLLHGLGVGLSGISVTVSNVDQNSIQIIENVPVAGG